MKKISIKHSITILQPIEIVWEFTQDYSLRKMWDKSVVHAEIIQKSPKRLVEIILKDKSRMIFEYKHEKRPHLTTLLAKNIQSPFIEKAGGSWRYEEVLGNTLWTQSNYVELKNKFILKLLAPVLRILIKRQTEQAMLNVKNILENEKSSFS